jgi:hypothetical protein
MPPRMKVPTVLASYHAHEGIQRAWVTSNGQIVCGRGRPGNQHAALHHQPHMRLKAMIPIDNNKTAHFDMSFAEGFRPVDALERFWSAAECLRLAPRPCRPRFSSISSPALLSPLDLLPSEPSLLELSSSSAYMLNRRYRTVVQCIYCCPTALSAEAQMNDSVCVRARLLQKFVDERHGNGRRVPT